MTMFGRLTVVRWYFSKLGKVRSLIDKRHSLKSATVASRHSACCNIARTVYRMISLSLHSAVKKSDAVFAATAKAIDVKF